MKLPKTSACTKNSFFPIMNWHSCIPRSLRSWVTLSTVPAIAVISLIAYGSGTPPSIPAISLANEPLYAAVTVDKPAMALALSVEYPTVGAQYISRNSTDAVNTYSNTDEYLGYYDAESCYTYNDAPTEAIPTGRSTADYKRFDRSGPASNRQCTNAFSGNFLNWASSSAIDMLRLALSGGDRYIDTPSLTILQRAVLPNGDPVCMWNGNGFPSKQLSRNGGDFLGAVPTAMRTAAGNNNIYIANTLNKIYFGTTLGGDCTNTGSYSLGGPSSEQGPRANISTALPADAVQCATDGSSNRCSFSGIQEVWFGTSVTSGRKTTYYWTVGPAVNGATCYYVNLGDPLSGSSKSCYVRPYTGNWTPSANNIASKLNSDGFFYSRVQVCNANAGVLQDNRDYNLCRQYPNGNYKPTGVIQKYSDQLRLAAFGYLMDQSASYANPPGRYGGVLRAPMKYVGTKTYNENGQDNTPAAGNPKAEWNPNTGVFLENPENHSMQISGVVNYLNKFGRTGPTPGRYKQYDPVGEMYYQSLRYLQGLQPTPDAVSNLTDAMRDGFPVYENWSEDPYGGTRTENSDYSCLKSNIVVVGDVNTHDGNWRNIPSTDDKANNNPNFRTWHTLVQSFEKNIATTYPDGQGTNRISGNPNGANNNVPSSSQTSQIMGYAYWAHTHDIRGNDWTSAAGKKRPGLRVKTYLFDVNENGTMNDANTRRTANQFFMASKYGGFESDPSNQGSRPYNTWGNPFKQQDATNNNNVWQKIATPNEASSYYLQSNARAVLSAFDEIFSRASTSARSIAGVATPSSIVSRVNGAITYSAKFDTSNWSGDVVAEPVSVDTSNQVTISTPLWSAANQLNTMTSPATNRNIVVGASGSNSNPTATNFTWSAISTQLQTDLAKINPSATPDSRGEQRMNYIRGDRSLEGNPFRVRSSLLGDIVNSNVVYSGAPSSAYTGTGYAAFSAAYASRTNSVFVGANDGMLHAFNAANGNELFGYIPSWLGPKLAALTDVSFTNSHQNYVDAPLAVAEAQVANNGEAADWKTVLVGGTGSGGSGVFALDVTNPGSFTASNVMWEFTRNDDSDLGQVIGQPQILKFKTSGSASPATYRWFAVVGSGVNNYTPETSGGPFSATGDPAIFLLALDKPAGTAWSLGTNYFKISLTADNSLKSTKATGVANFTALYGSNGEVTDIYSGDFYGNLWKLRFSNKPSSDWNLTNLSYIKRGSGSTLLAAPLFIARDGSSASTVQAIFAAPTIFTGPMVSGVESFYISFGTGKYLESADNISTSANSFYVIYDNNSTSLDTSSSSDGAIVGRSRLMAGTVNTTTKIITVPSFRWGRASSATDTTKRSGWYFDLPTSGEKLVSNIADLGLLNASFNTVIPGSSGATAGSCANNQGSGNSYLFNISSGSGQYKTSTVGVLGPSVFFQNEDETSTSKSDSTGRRIRNITKRGLSIGQSGASASGQSTVIPQIVGRISWRQVHNYQDMKNATP